MANSTLGRQVLAVVKTVLPKKPDLLIQYTEIPTPQWKTNKSDFFTITVTDTRKGLRIFLISDYRDPGEIIRTDMTEPWFETPMRKHPNLHEFETWFTDLMEHRRQLTRSFLRCLY